MNAQPFKKRELFLRNVRLAEVNLDQVAEVVASELGVDQREVFVVDARDDLVTLDVLDDRIDVERIAGKRQSLLDALSGVPGLRIGPESEIHSEGVLGLLNLAREEASTLVSGLGPMQRGIRSEVERRALVFPTGNEVISGRIVDTNTPFLIETLRAEGFVVEAGPAIADDVDVAVGALAEAASRGFGLVVTTGGTGAETKDCTIEAIQALDPAAATPYVVHYHRGQGRHAKDGVRVAVGRLDLTTYVALTGPHREVRLVTPVLVQGLKEQWDKQRLSAQLADVLRAELARPGRGPSGAGPFPLRSDHGA